MTMTSGTRLGRYEIRQPLGAGGMGEVYLGWDAELEREVAIKVLRGDREENPDRVRRFVQEAKAASALNHPNVAHVYEIGTQDDLRFIVMEVVEGETLRKRIARGQIPIDEVLSLGSQIAAALAAAHKAGIVHRDLKPENLIVHPDGYVKVLDFGLAKLLQLRTQGGDTAIRTESGIVVGTLHYMAPEQIGGSDVTAAADVFSLGVVLYEMATGRKPFEADSGQGVVSAILGKSPEPPGAVRSEIPPRLAAVIVKALEKDPGQRYQNAGELLEELKQISRETSAIALDIERDRTRGPARKWAVAAAIVLLLAVAAAAGLSSLRRSRQIRAANESIAAAEELIRNRNYADAYERVQAAATALPSDPRLLAVVSKTTTPATVDSDPSGATVYLQRFGKAERIRAGTTPLKMERLPRADYVVTFEKAGFAPATTIMPASPRFLRDFETPFTPPAIKTKLIDARRAPAGMVLVEGGPYRLAGWDRPSDRRVELGTFFLDRYEVSNAQFEEFIRAGGYRREDLWDRPFSDRGRAVTFEQALERFRDKTGLPGPRGWSGGAPPAGKENHPVTGITWYEAAAFARWKGKSLPTVFEWQKAARHPMAGALGTAFPWNVVVEGTDVTARANFGGIGTLPVDSMPFGISPWGAYHMAGNVSEWCLNAHEPGFAVRGGSWNDAVYAFGRSGSLPGFYASDQVGFRCALPLDKASERGGFELSPTVVIPDYKPVDDRQFETIRRQYDYVKAPLEARVVERVEHPGWRREKIEYQVAGKTVPAYLYIPKGFRQPLQVIHFSPAGDVVGGHRPLPASIESALPPFIRAGRAVFSVVLEGFIGRPRSIDVRSLDTRSAEYVDFVVAQVTELRRGLDYLETREDLDLSRLAFHGPSAGSWAGVILTAVDPRYRSVLFVGTDIEPEEIADAPAANRINFAPRIAAPKMMFQGRYDESAPLATEAEPLFKLLREPKRLEIYEGSHVPSQEIAVPIISRWFDDTLGPVKQ